ncbi:MAG: ACP S-malonyltransferase [Bdellovibrionales bacterium]|nr:ACP S-malonyltransferase [Bdellovibrionales bacterium]
MAASWFLMFPGQGSQYPGMAKDWFENFRESQLAFEEASDGAGLNLKKLCFEGSEDDLKQTEVTQPAILTATVAIFRALCATTSLGDKAPGALLAGHSLGEYSALVCAGALPLTEAARLVRHRGQYMQAAVPAGKGAMAALIYKPKTEGNWEKTQKLCAEASRLSGQKVAVANNNSPEQIVVAGYTAAVNKVIEMAPKEEWGARRALLLPVSAPFHSELMQPAAERLAPELRAAKWNSSTARYVANVDAQIHDLKKSSEAQERLVTQITGAVLWVQSVQSALRAGCTDAVEIGPGAVLSGLTKRIVPEGRALNIANIDTWEGYKNGSQLF